MWSNKEVLAIFFWILFDLRNMLHLKKSRWTLAIFFWILSWKRCWSLGWGRNIATCYFLLNFVAICRNCSRPDERVRKYLLFSFEFCSCHTARVLGPYIISRLAIFFWILLPLTLDDEFFFKRILELAIFFWILLEKLEKSLASLSDRLSPCYFLLNFVCVLWLPPVCWASRVLGLLFSFEFCTHRVCY